MVRTPRTNALFGQVIKLILAVVQANYRHGEDRADDGGGRALSELQCRWIRGVGWHEGSYRRTTEAFSELVLVTQCKIVCIRAQFKIAKNIIINRKERLAYASL